MVSLYNFAMRLGNLLSLAGALAACLIMFAMTGLILLEVILRSFFGSSTHIVEEYVSYGVGAMVFLALAHCLDSGQLIRVEMLFAKLPALARTVVELAICLVTLGAMALLIQFFAISVHRNFVLGTISMTTAETPLWIPDAVMLAGIVIFTFRVALYALSLLFGGQIIKSAVEFE